MHGAEDLVDEGDRVTVLVDHAARRPVRHKTLRVHTVEHRGKCDKQQSVKTEIVRISTQTVTLTLNATMKEERKKRKDAPAVELSGDALLQGRGKAQVEHVDVREGVLR